ncbi:MAG: PAS domain-containing protein, partial [Chloroflexi bacterium]|nr:PAS domain-containing protein [Chloroflexota bacterium]
GKKEFTEHDQRVVEAFAKYAATAIENDSLRVEAEEERGRLRAMIDSSAAAVIVADARDGRVVLSNQEAARMMGRTFRAGESKEGYEQAVVYRKADGGVYETKDLPLQQALKDGTVSRGVEVTLNLPDGREIPTIVNAAPVYGEDGEITAAIAIFEDITALQEVERVKAEFLSMVSHDLKGPLSGIKSMASALLMEHGPRDIETILEYLTSIDEETDRMTELVGNLVDMSRIEANAMPMDPEICHLADIVDESVRRFGRSRLGGQQRINVDVPLELPEIYADYDQVGRVITNLLSNASKYSSPGTEISINAYLDSDEGATIVTEVRDEGVGIPDDEIDKIFDKFYRVTTQRGRGRPGSGLGLAICRSIIMAHEGNIWVESKPGVGSTFRFSLPASIVSVGV